MGYGMTTELQTEHEILKVCKYGDPVLRRKSEPITEITDDIRSLAEKMVHSMFRNDGIGLAAPQVGVNIRLFTLATSVPGAALRPDASPGEIQLAARMPLALINPEIVSRSEHEETAEEGCLSLPGIYGNVTRPASVVLKTSLLTGETITVECGHLLGRCIQHEIDHLDGVLFVDHLSEPEYLDLSGNLRRLKKHTRRELKKQQRR